MEYRKVMDIIAYYLSEFDKRAFDEFGFETQTKGFDEIAALFGKKGSYLRRLRDEYDVTTSSFRRGQCNRPPRSRIIQTTDYLRQFSFEELTEIVRAFLKMLVWIMIILKNSSKSSYRMRWTRVI